MKMLCRLNRHYTSQYLLPYRPEGVYNNIHQPDWPPDSKDIAVPLATLILALTPRWTLLANLILRVIKLFPLVTFVLHRKHPSTTTRTMVLRETPTIGLQDY